MMNSAPSFVWDSIQNKGGYHILRVLLYRPIIYWFHINQVTLFQTALSATETGAAVTKKNLVRRQNWLTFVFQRKRQDRTNRKEGLAWCAVSWSWTVGRTGFFLARRACVLLCCMKEEGIIGNEFSNFLYLVFWYKCSALDLGQ